MMNGWIDNDKSAICKENSNGPSMDPCGTPYLSYVTFIGISGRGNFWEHLFGGYIEAKVIFTFYI